MKSGGEQLLNLPAVIHFPFFDEENGEQRFPFRTFLMLISIVIQLIVSIIAWRIFSQEYLSLEYDFFKCFSKPEKIFDLPEYRHAFVKGSEDEDSFLNDSRAIPQPPLDVSST